MTDIDAMPAELLPRELWGPAGYQEVEMFAPWYMFARRVGPEKEIVRVGLWPVCSEWHSSRKEPLKNAAGHRWPGMQIVYWNKFEDSPAEKGWSRVTQSPRAKIGYVILEAEKAYYASWSPRMRTHRRNQWLKLLGEGVYSIETIDKASFVSAFSTSDSVRKFDARHRRGYRKLLDTCTGDTEFYVMRRSEDGSIAAGRAVAYNVRHKTAEALVYFHNFRKTDLHTAVGLWDHLYREASQKGIRYITFGESWMKGRPEAWKGFSDFKSKFGLRYFYLPSTLCRIEITNPFHSLFKKCNTYKKD